MRIKDILDRVRLLEMPVRDFKRVGDFSRTAHEKDSSVFRRADIKHLRHPKTEALIRKGFSRFPGDIDVIVVNDGEVFDAVRIHLNPIRTTGFFSNLLGGYGINITSKAKNIVVVSNGGKGYVGDYGMKFGPMTAWMVIHRFWQSMYDYYERVYEEDIHELIERLSYAVGIQMGVYDISFSVEFFTFRSARENNLNGKDDLLFEALTQYCWLGEVRLVSPQQALDQMLDHPQFRGHYNSIGHDEWVKQYVDGAKQLSNYVEKLAHRVFTSSPETLIIS